MMENEILELLMQIQKDNKESRSDINIKLDNITNKLDTIKNDLSTVEVVTSKNRNDIAKLNAVK